MINSTLLGFFSMVLWGTTILDNSYMRVLISLVANFVDGGIVEATKAVQQILIVYSRGWWGLYLHI